MNILFITRLYNPHIGGVETHTKEVADELIDKGHNVTVLTEKYNSRLRNNENLNEVKIIRFFYPHIKAIGILSIWCEIFKRRNLLNEADIVHIHDVFIWYLPFKVLYPFKKVVTTFHGWETEFPIPWKSIIQRKIASKLSNRTIAVGRYIEKYYKIKADKIIYGGVRLRATYKKTLGSIVFLGRLQRDTGVVELIEEIKKSNYQTVTFVGSGELRKICERFGNVTGYKDPIPYLKTAEYVVPGGYLAALEALAFGCKLKLFWNNKLKEDYWKMSPFIKSDVAKWYKYQTWTKVANEYLDLYNSIQ